MEGRVGYIEGRKFYWSASNTCVACTREMHKKGKPETGKVPYHAKGFCSPCYQALPMDRSKKKPIFFDDVGQTCSKCLDHLPYTNFSPHARTRSGYNPWCNICRKLYKFNITKKQYLAMVVASDGRCEICLRVPEEGEKALSVDHDHECCEGNYSCGKCVRGLLCDNCNKGIGCLGDSENTVLAAYKYLKERKLVGKSK